METINSASLSMDPDEFVARMISAGVADIEVASQAASPRAQVGAGTLRLSPCTEVDWSEVDRPDSCIGKALVGLSGSACPTAAAQACLNPSLAAADHAQMAVESLLSSSWRDLQRSSGCKKALVPCLTACLPARPGECGQGLPHPTRQGLHVPRLVCRCCAQETALQVLL